MHETTAATNVVTVKGIKYRKGMNVGLGRDDEGHHMGEIKLILIHRSVLVYFVVGRQQAVELADL